MTFDVRMVVLWIVSYVNTKNGLYTVVRDLIKTEEKCCDLSLKQLFRCRTSTSEFIFVEGSITKGSFGEQRV